MHIQAEPSIIDPYHGFILFDRLIFHHQLGFITGLWKSSNPSILIAHLIKYTSCMAAPFKQEDIERTYHFKYFISQVEDESQDLRVALLVEHWYKLILSIRITISEMIIIIIQDSKIINNINIKYQEQRSYFCLLLLTYT